MESPETPRFRGILRLLDRQVSIGALIEAGLWSGLVYVIAGVVWLFLNPDGVERLQTQLERHYGIPPASVYEVAAVASVALWPAMLLLPVDDCAP
ncbi:hypothetical protein BST33_17775 [Mycolicibacter minnesotensis]|uniref:Uncharacterized protein n=1 Tax=Mycolicibacter minnesotensis TaxID=1118379 RepID=A0A7I7R6Q4_9MYCO|nr:hypothetical protein [Mycolicibacter minnesotensis]ORA97845.1 hypothetical protein BST33_17775 [Mycolicibacter minnesotensis]BBY34333.1 hypothetical protein MMIN_23940 [Mycolicibacter minnesotensis]